MFGRRGAAEEFSRPPVKPAATPAAAPAATPAKPAAASKPNPGSGPAPAASPAAGKVPTPSATPVAVVDNRSDEYYQIKTTIFSTLIDTIDLAQLAQLDVD